MNRLILILTLCFVISGITFSQARFFEGYIITNNQDTVHGLIEYKGNQTSTEVCIYKANEQSDPVSYHPNEIKGYRYGENKFYISKSVYRNGVKQHMFVEYLVDGVVDLYCYYENNNVHYLIQAEKDSLIELRSVKKVIDAESTENLQNMATFDNGRANKYIYESKTYVYILKDVFKASPKVTANADHAVLNHASLINLASTYHKEMCPDEECKIYRKGSDGHLKAGIMLGVGIITLSNVKTTNVRDNYLEHCDYVSKVYPLLGFFILTGLPGINANLYFQFEGSVNHMRFETSAVAEQYGNIFHHEVEFSQTSFNANGMFKYAFGRNKFKPIIQVGGFANFGVGESFKRDSYFSGIHISNDLSPFNPMDYGIGAGTGFIMERANKKIIVLDLRYRLGFKFIEMANTNYYTISVGYQL